MQFHIYKQDKNISGTIDLDGSKSISNRALMIRALCDKDFSLQRLSTSDDTHVLQKALNEKGDFIDIGAAGTSMRFLTAWLSTQQGRSVTITGSQRMQERPIGVLVDALRSLGADITYQKNEGYPPLLIKGQKLEGGKVSIKANTSSQYISALLMLGPTFEKGLELTLEGDIVSRPYIEMTLSLMRYFGVEVTWKEQTISIAPQKYQAKDFVVEADWSAASYHYALVALADEADLQLNGLFKESVQGDSVLSALMTRLGVQTEFNETGVRLTKVAINAISFQQDFVLCPDLAQTFAVLCAGLKKNGSFLGLQTLAIKETDRTAALQKELSKFGVDFVQDGEAWNLSCPTSLVTETQSIETYHDHRMAMAFAPLSLKLAKGLIIDNPMVVTKSYPMFWEDLKKLGFVINGEW